MPRVKKQVHKTLNLAEQIETDIRKRKLKEGDRYLKTVEAAKMLGVGTGDVNRALQLLVKRNVIVRSQRSGTFIASGPTDEDRLVLKQVHLLMGDTYPQMEGWFNHNVMLALQGELPGVRIQLHAVPSKNEEEEYVQQIIWETLKSPLTEGFVLMRTSLAIQRMLATSGLPVAVFGHPYASLSELPFVTRDQKQISRLMVQHILAQGHRSIAMCMRERITPGDQVLMEGARDVAGESGIGVADFSIHCLPQDEEEIKASVFRIIQNKDNPPGLIIRSPTAAEAIMKTIHAAGMKPHEDVSIVVADHFGSTEPPYPYIRTQSGVKHVAVWLGRLMWRLACGKSIDEDEHLVPVQLEIPAGILVRTETKGRNSSKRKR